MKPLYRKYVFLPERIGSLLKGKLTSSRQRQTFSLHLIYSVLDGIILGVLALNEFVLIKGLKGGDYQTAILFQSTTIILLFAILFNELLKRTLRKKMMLRIMAIATRLPLLLLFFFPKDISSVSNEMFYQVAFLAIFLIYFSANPIIFPVINQLLKSNYKSQNFSKFYSYAIAANKVVMLVVTFVTGLMLDTDPGAYTLIYPGLAVLGIASVFILMQIDYRVPNYRPPKKGLGDSVRQSVKNMWDILRGNRPFRDFEIGFILYGFAWLSTMAVIAIFLERVLELNYTEIAFYKNIYAGVSIIFTPVFGRVLGKIDPRKFAVLNFGALLLYILFMGITEYYRVGMEVLEITVYWTLLASFIFYGLFAAMMALLWYIGSAYFCRDQEAADYQSIHLTLTGFRGLFAPLIGIYFYRLIGYSGVFLLAITSLSAAVILMFWSVKHRRRIEIEATDIENRK